MIDRAALPRLGCDKDLVRGLGLFTAPRNLSHRAEEAASALGWRDFCQLLADFPIEGELLELCEGKMTKAVVPSHEFGLIVGSGEVDVLPLLRWRLSRKVKTDQYQVVSRYVGVPYLKDR